jgi:hypothetical protein
MGQPCDAGYAQHQSSQGAEQRRVQQGSPEHGSHHHPEPGKRLYFLSGFDPRGSSFYYRLFVEQLKVYARRSGRSLKVGRRRGQADPLLSSWHVEEVATDQEGATDRTQMPLEVVFLHWDDIVREHWPRSPLVIAGQGFRFALWYLVRGGLIRIARLCPSVALCGFYPLLFFGFCGVLLLGVWLLVRGSLVAPLGAGSAVLIASVVAVALLPACWRLADQQGVVWLFRSILFTHSLGQARDAALRPRLIELAQRIASIERAAPAAQVQLVGHSSGSFVMAMLAAELRRQPTFAAELQPRLSLLSLGQNLANLAVHKGAVAFHDDLRTLALMPRLPWRDITSPDDYLCFAGVDPYRSCGLQAEPPAYPQLQLIRLAPRLALGSWWALITNQFPLHFQYLHTAAPERQGGFDYFEELLGEGS